MLESSNQLSDNCQSEEENQNISYDIENVIQQAGDHHFYQKRSLVFIWIVCLFANIQGFLIPSTTFPPNFTCEGDQPCSEDDGGCSIGSKLVEDSRNLASITFELYCDRRDLRPILQSMSMVGTCIGLILMNYLSDNYSRKICILVVQIVGSIAGLVYALSPNYYFLVISNVFIGFGISTLTILLVVQVNDISNKLRILGVTMCYALISLSEMAISLIFEITDSWRNQVLYFFAIPNLILCAMSFYFIEDQPRFLFMKNKSKCFQMLQKIAKINNKEIPSHINENNLMSKDISESNQNEQKKKRYSYIDLFKYASIRRIMIPLAITAFFFQQVITGSQISLGQVGFSYPTNCLYVGIAELVGFYASDFICSRLKRKTWGGITLFIGCSFYLISYFFQVPDDCSASNCSQKYVQLSLVILARFSISFGTSFLFIQVGEAFPVTIRSIGFGFTTIFASLGGILSPYLVDFSNRIKINPVIILGFTGTVGCISWIFSKETFKKEILFDIKELSEENKILLKEDTNNNISLFTPSTKSED